MSKPDSRGFSSPVIEFFYPRKGCGIDGIDVPADKIYYKSEPGAKAEEIFLPPGSLRKSYENEFGGISMEFSDRIFYYGNFSFCDCPGVFIYAHGNSFLGAQKNPEDNPNICCILGFDMDSVARVLRGKEPVWENERLHPLAKKR